MCAGFVAELTADSTDEEIARAYVKTNDLGDSSVFGDDFTYERYIADLRNVTPDDSSSRSWLWQTCTEFGYY